MRNRINEKEIKKFEKNENNEIDFYLKRVKWEINDRSERIIETRERFMGAF